VISPDHHGPAFSRAIFLKSAIRFFARPSLRFSGDYEALTAKASDKILCTSTNIRRILQLLARGEDMSRSLSINHELKIVFSIFSGELTDQALLAQCAETSALPINSEYRELVDLTKVTSITATGQTVRAVASSANLFRASFSSEAQSNTAWDAWLRRTLNSVTQLHSSW
jgi:hypothetical protein